MTKKRLGKGSLICLGVCLVCVLVLVASRMAGTNQGQSEPEPGSSAPSKVYRAGVPFDLTGEVRGVDAKGNETWDPWDFSRGLEWTGTMRVTVDAPVLYDTPEDAGFAVTPGQNDPLPGSRVLVVDVALENVDATCRESVIKENGAAALNMMMFGMRTAKGVPCEAFYFSAPEVDGLTWDQSKSMSYTWVEQGPTAKLRIGYAVFLKEDASSGARGSSLSDADLVSPDDDFQMVLQTGWTDGAPIVELGPATVAKEPYDAG